MYNGTRSIAPGYVASDLNGKKFSEIIKFFKLRINSFYFTPGDVLKKDMLRNKNNDNGFMLIAISCIIFDMLCQYSKKLETSKRSEFIQFLEEKIPEFSRTFKKSGMIKYFYQKPTADVEDPANKTFASYFYSGFRCGIMHNAIIMPYGGFDRTRQLITEESWIDPLGKKPRLVLGIDPIILFKKVKKIFEIYIKNLSDLKNTKFNTLRDDFKWKFRRDFGFG